MWNLRNETNKRKNKERNKPINRLFTTENKQVVYTGEVGGRGEIGDGG